MFDESQPRKSRPFEYRHLGKRVIVFDRLFACIAPLHRLADKEITHDVLADQVERQKRMPQVIEHTEKEQTSNCSRSAATS